MKRGEIRTVAGGKDYAGKPRPVVILQDDSFDATASVTICGLTTNAADAPLARILIQPNANNGLRAACWLMADKIMTAPRAKLGSRIGRLEPDGMACLSCAVIPFLSLFESS
jgi:mRNA interferase MazF